MATAPDVISDARLREVVGVAGDEEDETLSFLRNSAIDYVAQMVSRNIISRTVTSRDLEFRYKFFGRVDALCWRIPDVVGINAPGIRYRPRNAPQTARGSATMAIDIGSDKVDAGPDFLTIYSAEDAPWSGLLEFSHPAPQVTVDVGMQAADIPAAWREATALLVRALYDGSGFDAIPANGPISLLLHPYRRWAYDR